MGSTKAESELNRDRKGFAEAFSVEHGVWGPGLLAGDLIHIHPISSNLSMALFGKVWKSGTSTGVGKWTEVDAIQEPTAYFIDIEKRSKKPHHFSRGGDPLLVPDIEGARLIGATSQGSILHVVIQAEGKLILRTFNVDQREMRKSRDLYLHDGQTKGGTKIIWDRGIASNGSQVFVFGRDQANALYLSKRDMGRNTHFQYLAQRNWSHMSEDCYPLISNAIPLISQAPVSMVFDGRFWVMTRTFGEQTTFWSSKHPRRGWSLVPGKTEVGNVRFQQVTTSLDSEDQRGTAVPYSVSRESGEEFSTNILNFVMPRP